MTVLCRKAITDYNSCGERQNCEPLEVRALGNNEKELFSREQLTRVWPHDLLLDEIDWTSPPPVPHPLPLAPCSVHGILFSVHAARRGQENPFALKAAQSFFSRSAEHETQLSSYRLRGLVGLGYCSLELMELMERCRRACMMISLKAGTSKTRFAAWTPLHLRLNGIKDRVQYVGVCFFYLFIFLLGFFFFWRGGVVSIDRYWLNKSSL